MLLLLVCRNSGECIVSTYNVVADGDPVDCLLIDIQSYKDLDNALELSRIVQREAEIEEERLNKMLVYLVIVPPQCSRLHHEVRGCSKWLKLDIWHSVSACHFFYLINIVKKDSTASTPPYSKHEVI